MNAVALNLVEVKRLAHSSRFLKQGHVLGMQLGQVKVHELAGIEAVPVGVEGYDAAELNVQIAAARGPLEPLLASRVVLGPVTI